MKYIPTIQESILKNVREISYIILFLNELLKHKTLYTKNSNFKICL